VGDKIFPNKGKKTQQEIPKTWERRKAAQPAKVHARNHNSA
jgi:hypothetical protein